MGTEHFENSVTPRHSLCWAPRSRVSAWIECAEVRSGGVVPVDAMKLSVRVLTFPYRKQFDLELGLSAQLCQAR